MTDDRPADRVVFEEKAVPRPTKRRRGLAWAIVAIILIIVAALVIFADIAARGVAEDTIESEVADRLPGSASDVQASIGGFSFLTQFFAGSVDQLEVSFSVDGEALGALAGPENAESPIVLSEGVLAYDGAVEFLGMQLGYTVTLEPEVDGGYLVLNPTGVEATSGDATVDLGRFLNLEDLAVRVCTAELLPEGMNLTQVAVDGNRMQLEVTGSDIPIDLEKLSARGSCD